ncbi:MAG TPA: ArsI/CadI family heavy metal resistance metalloenzyme [Polyangium sp.]|nr:ArsI/CadI family heavy metal resistance metalloenzyme [Polyangium sp.]
MNSEKTHVSLNVGDLGKAVAFYRAFFGQEPAKHYKDYAKFELDEPPLVLSLEPVYHRSADSFNHLGLRLAAPDSVAGMQERLKEAGLLTEREDDVECCYARQTKFWLLDPDKNLWEVYALTGEITHRGSLSASDALAARDRSGVGATWEHRLGDALVFPLPHADASIEEVRLRGTFNVVMPEEARRTLLAEVRRILLPGGRVMIHGLASDRVLPGGFPRLPGPAALVRHTPLESEPLAWLVDAGFVGLYVQKLGARPNFEHAGARMRELMIVGFAPAVPPEGAPPGIVVYKGPFRSVTDDAGRVYPRGERVPVDAATLASFERGPLADQFVVLKG